MNNKDIAFYLVKIKKSINKEQKASKVQKFNKFNFADLILFLKYLF